MSLHVVRLEAENFKRLRAVRITPEGNVIELAGDNGAGKSSVLDAIWVALKGRAVAPPEPIRQGEEQCYLELDLGKYKIIRKFTRKEDGDYTDFLRVEDPEGLQYPKPQATLDQLLGSIGFDPFAFVQLKPDRQAAALLELVPLEVNLEELRGLDKRLYDTRRDVNRDLKNAEARLSALPAGEPVDVPDVAALQSQLAGAAEHNGQIERRRANREAFDAKLEEDRATLEEDRDRIAALIKLADEREASIAARQKTKEEAEPLPEPIDTAELAARLTEARKLADTNRELEMRGIVAAEVAELKAKSESFTKRLQDNEDARQAALAKAPMPVDGLGVEGDDAGLHVTFNGVPFVQISKGEQLRVSTAIAMAGNPELRILRVSDGALLDDKSMTILQDMAREHDFQLWVELVRPNEATGIILEDGAIVGQELEPKDRTPKRPAKKIEAGLQDAIAYAKGDESAGRVAKGEAEHQKAKKQAPPPVGDDEPIDMDRERATLDDANYDTSTGEFVPPKQGLLLDEPPAQPGPTYSQAEWDALPAARRAFLSKKGIGPQ